MVDKKDEIYLATVLRAYRRFCKTVTGKSESGFFGNVEEGPLAPIIDEAERLAAGSTDVNVSMDIPDFNMTCLLENVGGFATSEYRLAPKVISYSKDVFPKKCSRKNVTEELGLLWQGIENNVRQIKREDKRIYAENLLNVLLRYASYVPSCNSMADVSLYDQTRVAAAMAACLYEVKENGAADEKLPFMLIGADFSGIQSYIYQIVSKFAAKSLKGRSFYIHLLSDACVGFIKDNLGLYNANVIYDSGGCFYLLAPNTPEVSERLDIAVSKIEKQIFEAHGTSIFVAIDSVAVSKDELMNKKGQVGRGLREVWKELFRKRDKKKYCKLANYISSRPDFFGPQRVLDEKCDVVTGEDHTSGNFVKFANNGYISELSSQQMILGNALRTCDCVVISNSEIKGLDEKAKIRPAHLQRIYYLLSFRDLRKKSEVLKPHPNIIIRLLNGLAGKMDFVFPNEFGQCEISTEFYGGSMARGKTLDELCDSDSAEGFRRLGVLRMDVDNLGSIFQEGIPENKACLSRYAAMSRSFDYYFSGYLNNITQNEKNVENSFVVYSGGDDLFIVGDWRNSIDIAKSIRSDFAEFTCNNPSFSISGGVAILKSKYPIIAGAEQSASEESNAKSHVCGQKEKDSIAFMNTPLHWSEEFPYVAGLKDILLRRLEEKSLPKAFISKVLSHSNNAGLSNHKITNPKTYWMMTYDMKRLEERVDRKDADVKNMIKQCLSDVCSFGSEKTLDGKRIQSAYHPLELWAFACRWAELEYRS